MKLELQLRCEQGANKEGGSLLSLVFKGAWLFESSWGRVVYLVVTGLRW